MNVLKRFLLSFMLMLTCTILYAQTEITGTVVDETGETVIGATVIEKGTTNGTVTDFDGTFAIKVNPGATLVFSYVGYLNVEMPASNGMVVTMKEDALALNEIVVTGYTTHHTAQGRLDRRRECSQCNRSGETEREQPHQGDAGSRAGHEYLGRW